MFSVCHKSHLVVTRIESEQSVDTGCLLWNIHDWSEIFWKDSKTRVGEGGFCKSLRPNKALYGKSGIGGEVRSGLQASEEAGLLEVLSVCPLASRWSRSHSIFVVSPVLLHTFCRQKVGLFPHYPSMEIVRITVHWILPESPAGPSPALCSALHPILFSACWGLEKDISPDHTSCFNLIQTPYFHSCLWVPALESVLYFLRFPPGAWTFSSAKSVFVHHLWSHVHNKRN